MTLISSLRANIFYSSLSREICELHYTVYAHTACFSRMKLSAVFYQSNFIALIHLHSVVINWVAVLVIYSQKLTAEYLSPWTVKKISFLFHDKGLWLFPCKKLVKPDVCFVEGNVSDEYNGDGDHVILFRDKWRVCGVCSIGSRDCDEWKGAHHGTEQMKQSSVEVWEENWKWI